MKRIYTKHKRHPSTDQGKQPSKAYPNHKTLNPHRVQNQNQNGWFGESSGELEGRAETHREAEEEVQVRWLRVLESQSRCLQRNQAQGLQSPHPNSAQDHAYHSLRLRCRRHGPNRFRQNRSLPRPHARASPATRSPGRRQGSHLVSHQRLGSPDLEVRPGTRPLHRFVHPNLFLIALKIE